MPYVYALDEDILIAEYPLHAVIHLSDVKEEFDKRIKITETPHLLLIKIHGIAGFGDDTQQFLNSDKHAAITKAAAILCDTESGFYEHGKMLIDNFIWLTKLRFPVQLFDSENDALNWLRAQNE